MSRKTKNKTNITFKMQQQLLKGQKIFFLGHQTKPWNLGCKKVVENEDKWLWIDFSIQLLNIKWEKLDNN